jgi:hypothetical protein
MWIVTASINEYNQEGDYFVAAYKDKPTFQQLKDLFPNAEDAMVGKLTRGGGREGAEYEWFELTEVAEGQLCY